MIDFQEKTAEKLQEYTRFQKDALASMQASGAVAVETYEKLARHNLDVMADFVGFTVDQAKAAASATDTKELVNRQVENVSAFAKVVEAHGKAFVDLVGEAASKVSRDTGSAGKAADGKVSKTAAKKSA